MLDTVATVSEAGISFLSLFGGFPKRLAPPENAARLWTGIAGTIAGLAFLAVKLLAHMSSDPVAARVGNFVALAAFLVFGILCIRYIFSLQARTIEFAGEPRIIGTEYTDAAIAYRQQNGQPTVEQTMEDYAGDTGQIWTPASLAKSRRILGVRYAVVIALLAFGLNLGIEVLTLPAPVAAKPVQAATDPSLKERLAGLEDVHFAPDKTELQQDAVERLDGDAKLLAGIVQKYPDARFIVEGHCDDRGSLDHNLALGYERAKAARDELVRSGVPVQKLQLASYGKGSPLCNDGTEACHRKNRRVHLTVVE